ncbi:hypothetical protein [Kitasatospora sp. NPDC057015]|uniref:hypothetical protein n=1 Tax=Kitasatospora sp. NPDC057015 TaxID=3346001 RepID=UPI00362A9C16
MDSMIGRRVDGAVQPRPAIYLRCYPYDPMGMDCHVRALQEVAAGIGVSEPLLILDNGLRIADGLPGRERLLRLAEAGVIDAVLVPGPFVFSLDAAEAASVVAELEARGDAGWWSSRHGVPAGAVRPAGARPG